MTVYIYSQNSSNLKVLLVQLQPQLSINDDIYIISSDKEVLKTVALYGSTRQYIFVETGNYTEDKGREFALQSMNENKQDGLLTINENILISNTFINSIKKAKSSFDFDIVAPFVVKALYFQLPSSFSWYNPSVPKVVESETFSTLCYYMKSDKSFNKSLKIGVIISEPCILLHYSLKSP